MQRPTYDLQTDLVAGANAPFYVKILVRTQTKEQNMAIPARVLKQLGHPSGLTGRLILRMLNRVNSNMNSHALAALDIRAQDKVLEIGFGGGALMADILAAEQSILATGCDISKLAVRSARRRFKADKRARFEHISGENLPYDNSQFTKVVGVNVIYFWQDQRKLLGEVLRVLENGGRVVICYSEYGPKDGSEFKVKEIESQLRSVGFENLQSSPIAASETDSHYCTVGVKPDVSPAE